MEIEKMEPTKMEPTKTEPIKIVFISADGILWNIDGKIRYDHLNIKSKDDIKKYFFDRIKDESIAVLNAISDMGIKIIIASSMRLTLPHPEFADVLYDRGLRSDSIIGDTGCDHRNTFLAIKTTIRKFSTPFVYVWLDSETPPRDTPNKNKGIHVIHVNQESALQQEHVRAVREFFEKHEPEEIPENF